MPTKAESLGITPPNLSDVEMTGERANAQIASRQLTAKVAAQEQYRKERAAYEHARDEALWKRIEARRSMAI